MLAGGDLTSRGGLIVKLLVFIVGCDQCAKPFKCTYAADPFKVE